MDGLPELLRHIECIRHSPIRNYVVPGITSWVVGEHRERGRGMVRLLTCERKQMEFVTPHSHRFDFRSVVLAGTVRNELWTETEDGDLYAPCTISYDGTPGSYSVRQPGLAARWAITAKTYGPGESYGMPAEAIHSIQFSRGAALLIFEGPSLREQTTILQPVAYGKTVPTFRVESWMFLRPDDTYEKLIRDHVAAAVAAE